MDLNCIATRLPSFFYESSNTSIFSIKDKVVVCSRVRTKFLNQFVFLNFEFIVGLLTLLHLLRIACERTAELLCLKNGTNTVQ